MIVALVIMLVCSVALGIFGIGIFLDTRAREKDHGRLRRVCPECKGAGYLPKPKDGEA